MKTSGFFTRDITEFRDTDRYNELGLLRFEGNKIYRWVKNLAGEALVAGNACYHGTVSAGTMQGHIYKMGQSSKGTGLNFFAGIAVSAIPDTYFGWIQVYGECAMILCGGASGSNVVSGDNLLGVSGQWYMSLDTATGTAAKYDKTVIAMGAGNSNGTAIRGLIRAL